MKPAIVLFSVLSLPVIAVAQSTLQSKLDSELVNRSFQTKFVVGNVLVLEGGRGLAGLADTNVFPDGTFLFNRAIGGGGIELQAISRTCEPNRSNMWLRGDLGGLISGRICVIAAGTTVRVIDISLKGDRLETLLWAPPTGIYGKLKFIFGNGWQKTLDAEQVMELVANALVIERIEQARTVASEYAVLRLLLDAPAPSTGPPEEWLPRARSVRETLDKLIANRTRYEQLGKGSFAQEKSGYTERIRELDAMIATVETRLHNNRVEDARNMLAAAESEVSAFRDRLASPPKSLAELKNLQGLLQQWKDNRLRRDAIERDLSGLGAASPDAGATAVRELNEIENHRTALTGMASRLEIAELDADYVRMRADEKRLMSAYVAAFDSPRQRESAAALRSHLQAMIANRERVQGVDKSAATEIQRLRAQARKVQ